MRWLLIVASASACAPVAQSKPTVIANRVAPQFELRDPHSAIGGVVKDAKTAEPLAGVTIIATSPQMMGTQAAISDENGNYKLDVPPGEYRVTFYYADVTLERNNVHVMLDHTTPVYQMLVQR